MGYSFDVKICALSIYDVFRVIRALLRGFKSSLVFYNGTNPVLERCAAPVASWGSPWFWYKNFFIKFFEQHFSTSKKVYFFSKLKKSLASISIQNFLLFRLVVFSARSEHSSKSYRGRKWRSFSKSGQILTGHSALSLFCSVQPQLATHVLCLSCYRY